MLQRYRTGVRNMASARYLDRFEKRNGEWRVAHRTLVFGDLASEEMKTPHRFPPEFTEQKHGMDDPLYARESATKVLAEVARARAVRAELAAWDRAAP